MGPLLQKHDQAHASGYGRLASLQHVRLHDPTHVCVGDVTSEKVASALAAASESVAGQQCSKESGWFAAGAWRAVGQAVEREVLEALKRKGMARPDVVKVFWHVWFGSVLAQEPSTRRTDK